MKLAFDIASNTITISMQTIVCNPSLNNMTTSYHLAQFYLLRIGVAILVVSCFLAVPSLAQVGGIFKDNNRPVFFGNISVRLAKAQMPVPDAEANGDEKAFVQGVVRLTGTVYRLDPATYRFNGESKPLDPVIGGYRDRLILPYRTTVGFGQYKVTSRKVIEAVLLQFAQQGSDRFRLLWRGHLDNMARGFREKRGQAELSPLQVGVPSLARRYNVEPRLMSMGFVGDAVNLERGKYRRRGPEANFRITGSRQGFIEVAGKVKAAAPPRFEAPDNTDTLEFSGMLNIRRNLRTIGPQTENFGPGSPEIGKTYEVGTINGRIYGVDGR